MHHLQYDLSFRWALDIQEDSDATLYVSPRTLFNFRTLIKNNGLESVIFNDTTKALLERFNVDCTLQRLDSVHFNSNMKRLSRLGVMTATVEDFLKALRRENTEAFQTIDPTLIGRYLDNGVKGFNYFGHVKPSERDRAMLTVANDIFTLITNFQSDPLVSVRSEFGLLERVFNDQCRVSQEEKIQAGSEIVLRSDSEADSSVMINVDNLASGDDVTNEDSISVQINKPKVELIPSKDISSGSLQNPSDPDAAFSGHKGQGYHAQLVETYTPADNLDEADERPLNLITFVKVEKANESDAAALIPVLDELEKNGLKPEVLTADTAYGGDANFVYAASKGVDFYLL
jgi:hypothetical protein